MTQEEFRRQMAIDVETIEQRMSRFLRSQQPPYEAVLEAMRYSLLGGGKRIRPLLVLWFCRLCGGEDKDALNAACGIEMLHTYSLIHDDLPCMDNDDLRRGRPSCHKAFGEAVALLAGDGLLTMAFEAVCSCPNRERAGQAALELAHFAGARGMIGGQTIDLEQEGKDTPPKLLNRLHRLKTGALIRAACRMGCILGGGTREQIHLADRYGRHLGLAFQIIDDILDVTSTTEDLGKPIGSDAQQHKTTYVTLYGLEKSKEFAVIQTQKALDCLEKLGNARHLVQLTNWLLDRTY